MNRQYTPDDIAEALTMLGLNYGNVALTAMQLGIPKRTLFRWKRAEKDRNARLWHKNNPPALPETPAPESLYTDDEDPEDNPYGIIRRRLVNHILKLTRTLDHDPYQLQVVAIAISRMIDRVIKLESLDSQHTPQVIRIEYKDPDGSMHTTPMWRRDEETPGAISGATRAKLTYLDDEFNSPPASSSTDHSRPRPTFP